MPVAVLVRFTKRHYWETHQKKIKESLTKVSYSYFSHVWNEMFRFDST